MQIALPQWRAFAARWQPKHDELMMDIEALQKPIIQQPRYAAFDAAGAPLRGDGYRPGAVPCKTPRKPAIRWGSSKRLTGPLVRPLIWQRDMRITSIQTLK